MLSSFMLTTALYIAAVASARPQALHDGITTVCKSYNPNLGLNVHSATNASATLSCASTAPI